MQTTCIVLEFATPCRTYASSIHLPRCRTPASPPIARCAAAQWYATGEPARLAPDRWGLLRAGEQKAILIRPLAIEAMQAL